MTVRKPEQGTAPKLFYIEGNDIALHPTATERTPASFMWADVNPLHDNGSHAENGQAKAIKTKSRNQANTETASTTIRVPQTQGQPWRGPIQIGEGRMADHMVQVGYNAQHKVPWHWPVPAYLVTKGIGVAVYTAFLFAQAEGQDLWQSPLLPFHLVVQAFVAGSGAKHVHGPGRDWRSCFNNLHSGAYRRFVHHPHRGV